MTKKIGRNFSKKWILIPTIIIAVLIACAGYYYYRIYLPQIKADRAAVEKAQTTTKDLNLIGDTDIATAYVGKIQAGDIDGAARVFTDRIEKEGDKSKKLTLFKQYVSLALSQGLLDQALSAALAADALANSYGSHSDVARVYHAKGDNVNRIIYIQKTISSLDAAPDFDGKQGLRESYVLMLDIAQRG